MEVRYSANRSSDCAEKVEKRWRDVEARKAQGVDNDGMPKRADEEFSGRIDCAKNESSAVGNAKEFRHLRSDSSDHWTPDCTAPDTEKTQNSMRSTAIFGPSTIDVFPLSNKDGFLMPMHLH